MPPDDTLPTSPRTHDLGPVTTSTPSPPSHSPPAGQLGTFALLGAAVGAVPFPWLPSALARRLRGALVQDIAARHGLSLSPGARSILAEPTGTKKKQGAVAQAFGYIGRKVLVRFGPLAVLPPLRSALEMYVLGYLVDRYIARTLPKETTRLEVKDARLVLHAIERAVVRVASPEGGLQWPATPHPPEELRDELTQALDGLLSATSTIPSWLLHRLDLAFDEVLAER